MENMLTKFVLEAEEAAAMARAAGMESVADWLPSLVPAAKALARAPISDYKVGAVGLGASGRIYVGVNLEFPGLPLHHSVHAEQFMVTNAAAHGEEAIRCFAVSSVPCGHCRQFLQEIRGAAEIEVMVTAGDRAAAGYGPLARYLPDPFGPPDLLPEDAPLLLEPHDNKIGSLEGAGEEGEEGRLREAAKRAARGAHAPYSGWAAGVAVGDGRGGVHAGGYVESAAYNPSLGPVQAAMVAYVAAGGGEFGRIKKAAVVEGMGAKVAHEGTARLLLAAVAPEAEVRVYRFRRE